MSRTHYYHHHPHCHCHCYNDMMYNNRIFRVVIKTFFICFPLMDFYVEFFWFSSEWRQKWRMINDEVNTSLRIETPERNERKNKNLNTRYWRGFYPFNTIIIYIYNLRLIWTKGIYKLYDVYKYDYDYYYFFIFIIS